MSMNRLFDQDAVDADFSDEFVEALGGIGSAIVSAYDKEDREREISGDAFDDEDDEDKTAGELLGEMVEDKTVAAGRDDDGDDARVETAPVQKKQAYSKEDLDALATLAPSRETAEQRELRELRESVRRLTEASFSRQAPSAPQTQGPQKVKPTGIKEVDEYLAEQGVLDNSPEVPRELLSRLEQLETMNARQRHEAAMQQRANAIAADAMEKASRISKVFRDVPADSIAEVIIASGDPTRGLEFAKTVYRTAGVLGDDGLPVGHLSDLKRSPMPHTRGVQSNRAARRRPEIGGWTPTNDPAERAKRMAGR